MNFGEFLKSCRERIGMNQSELACRLNLSQSDISKIEKDHKEPRTSIFRNWTIQTQSVELGIAFLYGTELLTTVPELITTVTTTAIGFINILGGWL